MIATAIDRRVKQLLAAEYSASRTAKREQKTRRRERAERDVTAEARAAEKLAKKQLADAVEVEIRKRSPFVDVHAAGKVIRVEISAADPTALGFAIEAARRACHQAAHRFADKVTGSRAAGREAPETDWLGPMWGSEAGLLYARRRNIVTVRDEEKP